MSRERRAKLDCDDLPTAVRFVGRQPYHLECQGGVTACGVPYDLEQVDDGRELGQLCRTDICGTCLYSKAFKSLSHESIGWQP